MSDAPAKGHPIGAFIILLVICILAAWGFSLMNDGNTVAGAAAGALLFAFGSFGILVLGPDRQHA